MSSSSATGNEPSTAVALPEVASPLLKAFDFDFTSTNYEFDDSISEEERRFYLKMYPTVDTVNQRKVHCTVCKMHVGTSPSAEQNIKMHPILRVTHCSKCHDFYNSGEFSKGEDGSELYCRWCGQGGEVYCCSTCPFVFCKSCIIKNLSRGVIIDIEQNENWNCFKCTSKILWPLRAQHWALTNYIETQKNGLQTLQLPEAELRKHMIKDKSSCCRLAKAKISGLSDSMESLESNASKRSRGSSVGSAKKSSKSQQGQGPPVKRPKSSNDEVVCTPDLLSMLEPDCQISVTPKPTSRATISIASSSSSKTSTPRIVTVQQNYTGPSPSTSASTSASSSSNGNAAAMSRSSLPPPLVLSSSGMRYRGSTPSPASSTARAARNPVPSAIRSAAPVFHTINGYRVDLNSAAQQDSYRLPNGRLIQVKRQMPANAQPSTPLAPAVVNPQLMMGQRGAAGPRMLHNSPAFGNNIGIYNPQSNPQQRTPQMVRMNNSNQAQSMLQTNSNGGGTTITMTPASMVNKPTLVRQTFPDTPIGKARKQLQDRVFNAMEICTHLTGKVQSFTNSNAYNTARSSMELKELYVHISYMMTYAIGRFKQLQDKCLVDMREMGFKNDANSLENGQLAAAVDYVCYGQLDDVDLYNTGSNSFHNQVYEYRKSLHANLKDGEHQEPLPPLRALGESVEVEIKAEIEDDEQQEQHNINLEPEAQFNDDEDDDDDFDDEHDALDTEENMNRNEQAHAYDRKLTRLLREYPSIWCTQHPDYGNMEITHKQWRVIASHFPRGDDIKLRWKNVRKRYVRIERRLKQGKRFRGYCDKATNYLANRDLPLSEWLHVDCGEDDGDGFERKQLDAIENTIHQDLPAKNSGRLLVRPIEVCTIDQRIINFAKSHPVLWRKSADPEFNSIDEQTRKSLWYNFCKTTPKKQASDDEDNEIEIVEPKTDTITIDSDNDDEPSPPAPMVSNVTGSSGLKITSVTSGAAAVQLKSIKDDPAVPEVDTPLEDLAASLELDVAAFSSSILASLLEVDIQEGVGEVEVPAKQFLSPNDNTVVLKKQPRKKTTNKPNPALLQLERLRMDEMKRNDPKLKMKLVVNLTRAEDEYEVARKYTERINKPSTTATPASEEFEQQIKGNSVEKESLPEKSPVTVEISDESEPETTKDKTLSVDNEEKDVPDSNEDAVQETQQLESEEVLQTTEETPQSPKDNEATAAKENEADAEKVESPQDISDTIEAMDVAEILKFTELAAANELPDEIMEVDTPEVVMETVEETNTPEAVMETVEETKDAEDEADKTELPQAQTETASSEKTVTEEVNTATNSSESGSKPNESSEQIDTNDDAAVE